MDHFQLGQRVKVVRNHSDLEGLFHKTGRVHRLRIADDGAWVRMECDLLPRIRSFPADDGGGRGNDIILYPEDCELA